MVVSKERIKSLGRGRSSRGFTKDILQDEAQGCELQRAGLGVRWCPAAFTIFAVHLSGSHSSAQSSCEAEYRSPGQLWRTIDYGSSASRHISEWIWIRRLKFICVWPVRGSEVGLLFHQIWSCRGCIHDVVERMTRDSPKMGDPAYSSLLLFGYWQTSILRQQTLHKLGMFVFINCVEIYGTRWIIWTAHSFFQTSRLKKKSSLLLHSIHRISHPSTTIIMQVRRFLGLE